MCAARQALDVAVVGGGWAGCAAAVHLADAGCRVTVFEAARSLGGRARAVELDGRLLDNGQHILLGAYTSTLRLLRRVGVDPKRALLRVPLQMRYPAGQGALDFIAPRLPAPLHLAAALLRARGLARADKLALARFFTSARWMAWHLNDDCSVAELLERFDQTASVVRQLWRPLCIAALNTPPERASARVFLAVLRDSLGARRAASDMLLPRIDLGALFPAAAARFVEQRGGEIRLASRVDAIALADGCWRLQAADAPAGAFDAVVLATAPWQAAALLEPLPGAEELAASLASLEHEPIATCYLQYDRALRLDLPFCALQEDPASGNWGQFVFDRGQLDPAQAGLLAVVVSAAGGAAQLGRDELARAIGAQLAAAFQRPQLASPASSTVITEKRATFSCSPGLARPAVETGLPGVALAGDYTASEYPATLESAARSGRTAATAILAYGRLPRQKCSLSHPDGGSGGA